MNFFNNKGHRSSYVGSTAPGGTAHKHGHGHGHGRHQHGRSAGHGRSHHRHHRGHHRSKESPAANRPGNYSTA